jgi:nitric oxide reductase activation protein
VTEFKSFNLFLNRMAKKKTTQGIGYINNRTEFDSLVTKVASIIIEEFNGTSHNATAINNVKRSIDNLVGRTRQSFTKTDVYQVSYLMFYPILKELARTQNRTFKETQVNTLVAKLMTEGEYGNPSVVRRQTTDAKLTELKNRLFPTFSGRGELKRFLIMCIIHFPVLSKGI